MPAARGADGRTRRAFRQRRARFAVSTRIDGLCNVAGVPGTVPDALVARVNYLGLRHLTWELLPMFSSGGSIVNVASVAGCNWRERIRDLVELARTVGWEQGQRWIDRHPHMNDAAYRKFKEALLVWTQIVAPDLMRSHGVRMNCVSPGPVDTPILADFKASLGQANVDHSIAMTGRAGTSSDIAPAIVFLLTQASSWVVGSELIVDGGLMASRLAEAFPATSFSPQG